MGLRLRRCAHAVVCIVLCPGATTLRAEPARGPLPLSGFSTELRPLFDPVFPDSLEYQQALDRAADLCAAMRRVSDEFARAVQEALQEVNLLTPRASAPKCPPQVARSYARAQAAGQEYLRIGRELMRHQELVRELDRLGDSAGLTPDYRARVQHLLREYEAFLTDYREMKATFHAQLTDELRFAGCDLGQKVVQAPPAQETSRDRPRAEAVAATMTAEPRGGILFYVDNRRCHRGHRVLLDGQLLGEVGGSSRAAFRATTGPHELCLLSHGPPGTRLASAAGPPAGLLSSGTVQDGGTRDGGAGGEGDLVSPAGQRCGDPGTVRRSYLHDGWTIALRCE